VEKMRFSIEGEYPVLRCILSRGEEIVTSAGNMSWMDEGFDIETTTGGGLMKGLARAFTGEGIFRNVYKASKDNLEIAFASSLPGKIMSFEINGETFITQKSAFLASEASVKMDTVFTKKFSSGLLGGEGFILQKFSGKGLLFLEADGSTVEYNLDAGQSMLIDQGHVFMFEESVRYDIETVKGIKNVMFGGEGLFLVKLTGPGKVILQTMPVANLASKIIPYVPSSK
jgi:uncharacterized protein (TIGR00266 family)